MKRAHLGVSVVSLLAVGLLTFSLAGPARAVAAGPASGPNLPVPGIVVLDCPGQPALVRPKTFILSCADGYVQLNKLSWTSWTPGLASATGTLVKNTCTPSCVAGHFHAYPVLAILWGKAAVKNHLDQQCYTRLTLIYPGSRPQGAPQTQTIPLPTSLPGLIGA